MPTVVTEYRNNYFNIFVQEKDLQMSTLVKDPVPSNVQEVKEMDELCYNWRKKKHRTLINQDIIYKKI